MGSPESCSRGCSCSTKSANIAPPETGAIAKTDGPLMRSVFRIPGMDCPTEEQMLRLRLAGAPIASLEFDLPGRTLVIHHTGDAAELLQRMTPLGYGAELEESGPVQADESPVVPADDAAQVRVLRVLLAINATMFVVEMIAGWWAGSAGLISDAADMFADAAVYGASLYAVGRSAKHKLSAAKLAGLLQLALALSAITETGRRVVAGSLPEESAMIGISLLALLANVACLTLISRHRTGGVHMRASYIFSANDVLANAGVIVAGVLVAWTASPLPDWIIGFVIGTMVLVAAIRILRLK